MNVKPLLEDVILQCPQNYFLPFDIISLVKVKQDVSATGGYGSCAVYYHSSARSPCNTDLSLFDLSFFILILICENKHFFFFLSEYDFDDSFVQTNF